MKDRELDNKLKSVDLPQVSLPGPKARLRRELMSSPHFEQRSARMRIFGHVRYVLTALTAVIVGVFVVIQFLPKRSSARALINTMETAYESSVVSDAVHYIRQTLTLPRGHNFDVEQWLYLEEGKIRVRLEDKTTGDVIAHSIITGGEAYNLNSTTGRAHSRIKHGDKPHDPAHCHGRMLTVVFMRLNEEDEWGDETVVRAFVMDGGFDRDQFVNKTPRAIVSDLAASPDITYVGASVEPQINQKIEVLERRNAATLPFTLEFQAKHIEKVKWFLNSVISEEISLEIDSRFVEFLEKNDLIGEVQMKPIESVEKIEIIAESSRIHRVTLTIFESGTEAYRAERVFIEDRYLPYSPETFDPVLHGLTLQTEPQTKEF